MKKNRNKKLWSLDIPVKEKVNDKEIKEFYEVCKKKIGFIPNIIKTNSIDKKKFKVFNSYYNKLMQDENLLTKIEKEMIAVVVSSINRCLYCCISHGYNLSNLLKDKIQSEKILINYKTAELNIKYITMLDFVSKITKSSSLIDKKDRELLRKQNFSDKEILEIIEVASFFNMTNRIASATNMQPNEEYYL
tara:strand:+ start:392 stop:964 length:573 start_codon:yes stop_codon:yes gene_type:complete